MSTWRLFIFGREWIRTERTADADKTLGDALAELVDNDTDFEEDVEEVLELELGQDFVHGGRIADEMEHLIFSGEDDVEDV